MENGDDNQDSKNNQDYSCGSFALLSLISVFKVI